MPLFGIDNVPVFSKFYKVEVILVKKSVNSVICSFDRLFGIVAKLIFLDIFLLKVEVIILVLGCEMKTENIPLLELINRVFCVQIR